MKNGIWYFSSSGIISFANNLIIRNIFSFENYTSDLIRYLGTTSLRLCMIKEHLSLIIKHWYDCWMCLFKRDFLFLNFPCLHLRTYQELIKFDDFMWLTYMSFSSILILKCESKIGILRLIFNYYHPYFSVFLFSFFRVIKWRRMVLFIKI